MSGAPPRPRPGVATPPQSDTPLRLAAAFRRADGRPRFTLTIPAAALNDPGVRLMARHEAERGGYEYPARRFLDAHLGPGDLFLDVGAHWGIFALHAASLVPGPIQVLAVEPHPDNARHLLRLIAENGLGDSIEVITVAAGAYAGTAPLVFNSTMAHSLHGLGLPEGAPRLGQLTVPVLPLDLLLKERPELAKRPTILKIDAEGYEPEVIEGATALLDSGRLKAVIWEHGSAFLGERRRGEALAQLEAALRQRGFRQFRFPHPTMGGPLIPYADTPEVYNVFALAPGLSPLPCYDKPRRQPEPLPPLERAPSDPAIRARVTRALIAAKATDGARWADFEAMAQGADERAAEVVRLLPEGGGRLLDIGAGVMALRRHLSPGWSYVPVDLLPWDPATVVFDLNQVPFPTLDGEVAVMVDVLEHLHDPGACFEAARRRVGTLIASYRPEGDEEARRAQGFFHDLTRDRFRALLAAGGWRIVRREDQPTRILALCQWG